MTDHLDGPKLPGYGPEPTPARAHELFGERLPVAEAYARSLCGDATVRGLMGPREAQRIWTRHLLNCGEVSALLPPTVTVADVGSGAGLPGIPLALATPTASVTLVESLARRASYLNDVVRDLNLDEQVQVLRARAEEVRDMGFEVVVSRAVAPLPVLVGLCSGLLAPGGLFLAMRGASAADELASLSSRDLRGLRRPRIVELGAGLYDEPIRVVVAEART